MPNISVEYRKEIVRSEEWVRTESSQNVKRKQTFTILLPKEVKDEFTRYAKQHKMKTSEALRKLVRDTLLSYYQEND